MSTEINHSYSLPNNSLYQQEKLNLKFLASSMIHCPSFYDLCVQLTECSLREDYPRASLSKLTPEDREDVKLSLYAAKHAYYFANKELSKELIAFLTECVLQNLTNFLEDFKRHCESTDPSYGKPELVSKLSSIQKILKKYSPKTESKPKTKLPKPPKIDKFTQIMQWLNEGKTREQIFELSKNL